MNKYIAILILLVASTCYAEPRVRPESWCKPVIGTELRNIYCVDNGVYRSEQPDDDDVKDLLALGVKEVLSLREYHSDKDELTSKKFVLHRIKINTGKITEEEVIEALKIIQNRKGSILIHCWHGSDRTGTIIAAYRIIFNNWSKAQAIDEMANGGYGYHAKIYPGLIDFVENLNIDHIKKTLSE